MDDIQRLQSDIEGLNERLMGLELFIETMIPALIAGSSKRATLAAQLERLSQEDSSSADDAARHHMLLMADTVLSALRTG